MPTLNIAMLSIHSSPTGKLGTRNTGGMSVYVSELARELGGRGHQVDIFTRRREGDDPEVRVLAHNVRLVLLDVARDRRVSKSGLYERAGEALTAIEAFRHRQSLAYELIHSHYWISGHVGRMAADLWNCAHVITFHTLAALKAMGPDGGNEIGPRLAVEKALVRECNRLLVPCRGERLNVMRHYDAGPDNITLVPGGVDLDRFRPMDKIQARRKLGFSAQDLILLAIGRLDPLKGQDRIIKALPRIQCTRRPRLIVVGGDGPEDREEKRLRRVARETGVSAQIHFRGSVPQEELPFYYAAADIVLVASRYESFGLVGLEALACGRPLVTLPVGIMQELSRTDRCGLVISGDSSEALASAIDTAAHRLSDWPAAAIRNTARQFPWRRTAQKTLAAYEAALQNFVNLHGDRYAGSYARPRSAVEHP